MPFRCLLWAIDPHSSISLCRFHYCTASRTQMYPSGFMKLTTFLSIRGWKSSPSSTLPGYFICDLFYFSHFLWRPSLKTRKQSWESLAQGIAVLPNPCTQYGAWCSSARLPAHSQIPSAGQAGCFVGIFGVFGPSLILRENELLKMDSFFFFHGYLLAQVWYTCMGPQWGSRQTCSSKKSMLSNAVLLL